jgi:2-dehydro-3-deoxyphosphogluconate aldolase/(4S)-4-hydroxy-2-oxoglutarate aldolase
LLKLFPAEIVGGTGLLKAIGAPVPDLRFIPTGGISERTMADYLALPNVAAVGGSWFVNQADLEAGEWERIENRTRAAVEAASRKPV